MIILCGNGGTGKTYLINELTDYLASIDVKHNLVTFGEPDAINPTDRLHCLADFVNFFDNFESDIVILDSLRLISSLKGVLGKGGVNKNMANYITFLELCARRSGKIFVATFNPLDDDENVGGYFNILKSSCSSVILLDDTTSNSNFEKIYKTTSSGFLNGQALCTSRFRTNRSNDLINSHDVPSTLYSLLTSELDFIKSNPDCLNITKEAVLTNLFFDIYGDHHEIIKKLVDSSISSDNNIIPSDVSGRRSIARNRMKELNLNDDSDFESFKVD